MTQLKAYKNELIVGVAFLLLLISFAYKQGQASSQSDTSAGNAVQELKEVISLQKIWGDKKMSTKIDKLKTIVSPSKVKWNKKSKKLTASFSTLTNQELNALITKMMNIAVMIQKLEVKKLGTTYQVEFKCKW